ncbi:hypothetical protein DH2020_016941 [Rehmannia glutinosa]|uniref:Nudix hydrolase domain-containing protein n=1 Tax=Rehmannia glutinosa TaxID=99300 RepID=A0ABR0WS27_REHGL
MCINSKHFCFSCLTRSLRHASLNDLFDKFYRLLLVFSVEFDSVDGSLMDQGNFENGINEVQVLPSFDDEHGDVTVEIKEPMDPNDFSVILKCSLSHWKLQGKKGVWIKLPIKFVNLVETAVKEGFLYHHAEPHYLMLVYWIPETLCTIPANATHRIRIGAIIMNDKERKVDRLENSAPKGSLRKASFIFSQTCNIILLIMSLHTFKQHLGVLIILVACCSGKAWQLSGNRHLEDSHRNSRRGARREVKEETGIDTEFIDVLAFRFPHMIIFTNRQRHESFFKKSDLLFLCMLRPLSFNIQKQDSEIEAAQWMPISEYAAQPFAKEHSIFKYAADVCLAKVDNGYTGFTPLPIASYFDDQISYLYVNKEDLNL